MMGKSDFLMMCSTVEGREHGTTFFFSFRFGTGSIQNERKNLYLILSKSQGGRTQSSKSSVSDTVYKESSVPTLFFCSYFIFTLVIYVWANLQKGESFIKEGWEGKIFKINLVFSTV